MTDISEPPSDEMADVNLALSEVYLVLAELHRSFQKLQLQMEVLSNVVAGQKPGFDG